MTLLAVLTLVGLTLFTVVDAFTRPPTRRLPEPPADIDYWPGLPLHDLEV